jgi:AAA domain-containing protein/phospholipase D-like protein
MARRVPEFDQDKARVPLTRMLAEFRTALEQEIEAAKRNLANSAVSLVGGKRVAQIAGSNQYVFSVESPLNVPADTPADLIVPGKEEPIPATVVTVEDLRITVSVGVDLGLSVPFARLQSDLTLLLRRLIERIETKASEPNPACDRILGNAAVSGEVSSFELPENTGLNCKQREAVYSSLDSNTTFIWGPPGTGKTRTIGAIGEQLFRRCRSALLVSHTNTAVDEAVVRIAEALGSDCKDGDIVRVGNPAPGRLRGFEHLLLKTIAERRSDELRAQKIRLESERTVAIAELARLERLIAVCEWVVEGESDIAAIEEELADIHRLDSRALESQAAVQAASEDAAHWNMAQKAAEIALHQQTDLARTLKELDAGATENDSKRRMLSATSQRLNGERETLRRSEEARPLRELRWRLPTKATQATKAERARVEAEASRRECAETKARLETERATLEKTSSVGTVKRLWLKLPKPDEQARTVETWKVALAQASARLSTLDEARSQAETVLAEIASLESRLQPYASVPETPHQSAVVRQVEHELSALQSELAKLAETMETLRQRENWLKSQLEGFDEAYSVPASQLLADAEAFCQRLAELRQVLKFLNRERLNKRDTLEIKLSDLLEVLWHLSLTQAETGSAESILDAVKKAHLQAATEASASDLPALRSKRDSVGERLTQIDVQLKQIEEALKRVEEQIIADARILATTLTRAYLRDAIQGRRFDTVILDEASMAPIPALWAAASLASANVVVVGDFRQLPPIVQSNEDEAKRWLGRDIFEASGAQSAYESKHPPSFYVELLEQFRMHPTICSIPNRMFYNGELLDAEQVKSPEAEKALQSWYASDWGFDAPVLLVSTEATGAWVTAAENSRLNFLSATICVDLAEQLLSDSRVPLNDGQRPRILIVSPYRPHAKLVNLLLREHRDERVRNDVAAGTAHNFQGGEADVVILDLVVDEPHWRTNLTNPQADEDMKRLLNVAITRARRRLVVVGDFSWCMKSGRQAFLGRELLPFLLRSHKPVDALKIVPAGLAARVAKAQLAVHGGEIEPDSARLVVTQADFYPLLLTDISRSTKRIVIYSPFMTTQRVNALGSAVVAAIERGVRVFVVTKPRQERKLNELSWYKPLEEMMNDWGATIIHKAGMHEKLVFLDDEILWSGSLNPLSFSNTQEIMERRASARVVADFAETLRLADLLAAYAVSSHACPICGGEIVAAEGADEDPFYWRCVVDDCYSRGVDDPPLKDGMLTFKCGGAACFGMWGERPCWYCDCGRRHRVRFHPNHLRLPKMVALIPARELRALQRQFG